MHVNMEKKRLYAFLEFEYYEDCLNLRKIQVPTSPP